MKKTRRIHYTTTYQIQKLVSLEIRLEIWEIMEAPEVPKKDVWPIPGTSWNAVATGDFE